MISSVVTLVRRITSQDVARTNAAQAAVRLGHQRRQVAEVDDFIARLPRGSRRPGKGSSDPDG